MKLGNTFREKLKDNHEILKHFYKKKTEAIVRNFETHLRKTKANT